jgi:primosomal replication protein N
VAPTTGAAVQPDNELVLMGQLLKPAQVRVTPAGIPIARFVLVHRSRRPEAGRVRDVECRIGVVASGSALTDTVAARSAGSWCRVRGFMSRAGYRSPDMRVELHALEIQAVDETGPDER